MATEGICSKLSGRMHHSLVAPLDIASLAWFRILFGLLLSLSMIRFLARGWVDEFYVQPRFYFSYPGFEWVHPWPAFWMHFHFVCLALLAIGVAAGFFYRLCMVLFFVGFVYVELIDQVNYLNHYYLISLLAGLMIFLPANGAWSVDALRKPGLRCETVPAWTVNLLRFQIAIVYLFAGLAKFNADWLLHAEPLRIWLAARSDLPLIGPWLGQVWVAYAASWFGAIFDTTVVFFILHRRTWKPAFLILVGFHIATWFFFNIGIFPWIMIVSATLLFPADWPRYWLHKLRLESRAAAQNVEPQGMMAPPRALAAGINSWLAAALCLYVAVQIALPLRSYFSGQPVAWTCRDFNCAWRVMIAEKTGYAEFYAFDPLTGKSWKLPLDRFVTGRQELLMAQDPYLIRELARHLGAVLKRSGLPEVQIRVNAIATLNGRPGQPIVDPETDLAKATGSDWIIPLRD